MLPGMNEFYDAMHHQLADQIHEAQADAASQLPERQPGHSEHPADQHGHDGVTGHDSHHPGGDHFLAAADHHDAQPEEKRSLLEHILPAAVQGAAVAFVRFAAEAAIEHVLPNLMQADLHAADHAHPAQHVGSPTGDGFTHQTTGFTCAVVSQKMILDQFHLTDPQTGAPLSEARLVYDATAHHWLSDEHGTSLNDLNRLLHHYGVETHEGHDWPHLVHDLAAGHQVVMAVNADRLWHEHHPAVDLLNMLGNAPNHAIVVKGLRVDEHGKVVVVVNDPGQVDGGGVEYPLEHFQSAVDAANLHYIATDHAPADWNPAPAIQALAAQHDAHLEPVAMSELPSYAESLAEMNDVQRESFLRDL